jgi:polar amino acid transport system permease protein/polar amino acid transport system substrate-binding protein
VRTRRLRFSAILLLACALPASACGAQSSAEDTIVVGADLTAPPYASLEGDTPVGFDPEMVDALGDEMGRKVTIKDIRFEQLIPSLNAGQIDFIASDLYITAERAAVVDYIPYFSTGNSIMVRSDADPITALDGLCGKRVAVIKGGAIVGQLRDQASADCVKAGQQAIDVKEFPSDPEATQALLSSQVDAHVTDAAICSAIEKKLGGKVVVTSTSLLFPVPVGLAVKKGNKELKDALVDALHKLTEDGGYDDLLSKFNLQPVNDQQVESILRTS